MTKQKVQKVLFKFMNIKESILEGLLIYLRIKKLLPKLKEVRCKKF